MKDGNMTMADYETSTCPYRYFETLRKEEPVHFDAGVGTYLVSRYEDVVTVLKDPRLFSFALGGPALMSVSDILNEFNEIMNREGFGPFQGTVDTDPPYHTRIRSLTEKAFRAERVASLAPHISGVAKNLFSNFIPRGEADVVKEVAIPMTATVLGGQLGIPEERQSDFIRWTNATFDPLTGRPLPRERMLECAHEQAQMQRYLAQVMEERRKQPQNDIISHLAHAVLDGFDPPQLTFHEILSMVRSLLVAGNDTTNSAIGDMFLTFARQPELLKGLQRVEDRDRYFNRFIEEFLRKEAPITSLPRVATEDTVVGGVPIPKGAVLSVCYYSANHDEAKFENPKEFDVTRKNLGQHVTFGQGIHRCIGAALARGELKAVLTEIVDQIDEISIDADERSFPREHSIMGRRLTSLPIRFKAR
jgi:cytochrome P450